MANAKGISTNQEEPGRATDRQCAPGDRICSVLLSSGYLRNALIGIQLVPVVENRGDYVHQNSLFKLLEETEDHQEMTAILRALRSSWEARIQFSVGDLKRIIKLVSGGNRRDVRIASLQLLGCFGADIPAVKVLLDHKLNVISWSEYEAVMASLGRAQVLRKSRCCRGLGSRDQCSTLKRMCNEK